MKLLHNDFRFIFMKGAKKYQIPISYHLLLATLSNNIQAHIRPNPNIGPNIRVKNFN